MKNKFKIFNIILVVGLSFTACNDKFLERLPLDEISDGTFWNTENDLQLYNNSLYEKLKDDEVYPILQGLGKGPGVNFKGGVWWEDQYSDNLASTHGRASGFFEVRTGFHQVPETPRQQGYRGFDLVRAINVGLANYDRAQINPVVINRYKGEARLFRGWFYGEKVSKFGDVQYTDKVLNIDSEELYGKRDSRDFVMDKVLEDLNYAVANLPANWNNKQNPGRVTKWVALAVKSRICLFEGTWRKYHGLANADKWLNECVTASQDLMTNGGFSLYDTGNPINDYRYALSSTTQVGNPEVIYWRKYEALTNGHFASRLFWAYNGGATKSFVDDVLCDDGLPIALSPRYQGDNTIETTFINRDLRLRQCVLNPADQVRLNYANDARTTYPILIGQAGARNQSNTGFHVVKHWNAADEAAPRDQHTASPPCLRLGETLLNYVEAKAVLGTVNQADLDNTINKLRKRAGLAPAAYLTMTPPMDPSHASDGVSALMVEIRRERRVELFLEGFRYHDLRRWKLGRILAEPDLGIRWDAAAIRRYPRAIVVSTIVNGVPYIDVRKRTPLYPSKFDENKDYLWPIPISVISQNTNITQNPGW